MIFTGTELVCPAGKPGGAPLIIDLKETLRSEQRQSEVAFVTTIKAPELLREFNIAWRDLHKIIVNLTSEQLVAERVLERRKSVLTLEVVPGKLKELGLANNDSTRTAVITLDTEYQSLQDTVDQIDAIVSHLKGKLKAFENAFNSVRKMIGEDPTHMSGRINHALSGGAEPSTKTYASPEAKKADMPAPSLPTQPLKKSVGFGRASY
jgi:hypothetical protein